MLAGQMDSLMELIQLLTTMAQLNKMMEFAEKQPTHERMKLADACRERVKVLFPEADSK